MIKLKSLINEGSKKLTQVVKDLKSSDFGMTKAGGNGQALAKGGKLVIRDPFYYSPDKKRVDLYKREWDDGGTYGKYFNEEYGVTFKVDSVNVNSYTKMWDLPGYVEIIITVTD